MHRNKKNGFTLIEIVISMMFLSFGIMGVIALFFVGVTNGNLSIKNQQATIIALDVKDALMNALKYPRVIETENGSFKVYRFEMPSVQDTEIGGAAVTPGEIIQQEKADSPQKLNGFYFQINDETQDLKNADQVLHSFLAEEPMDKRVLDLPFEGMSLDFSLLKNQVWKYRPYKWKDLDSDYDEDDSDFYSFRIVLRRSVRYPTTGPLKQGDLLVATVYVFKQYDVDILSNGESGKADKEQYMKYDEVYGYPTFAVDEEGNTNSSIQPILKYEFYIVA